MRYEEDDEITAKYEEEVFNEETDEWTKRSQHDQYDPTKLKTFISMWESLQNLHVFDHSSEENILYASVPLQNI